MAIEKGLHTLALTDHDTLAGNSEAANAAKELAAFTFIPGIELEITGLETCENDFRTGNTCGISPGGEFHLLGLGIDHPDEAFGDALKMIIQKRRERNIKLLDNINAEFGLHADYSEIEALAGGKVIARPHFATFMINHHLVKNREKAFEKYLGKGRPLYVARQGMAFKEAAEHIHAAGGKTFVAHPLSLYLSWNKLPPFLQMLKDLGLDGIEAWHSNAKIKDCRRLENIAKDLGLAVSQGSDFHGANRPDRKLGLCYRE
jgi:predicted metal-dependent phosphoesterase TrpH